MPLAGPYAPSVDYGVVHLEGMSQSWIESEIERTQNDADRLRAESGLRIALVVPLAAILGYFVVVDSSWWLFGAILLPALYVQAYDRTRRYIVASAALFALRQHVGLPPATEAETEFRREDEGSGS